MGSIEEPYTDVLIVGAGFASFSCFHRLQKLGYGVTLFEREYGSGGIWHANCYPGARVDSENPIYQLFDEDLVADWTYSEAYPNWQELRRYFKYVEKKWNILEHTQFNKCVEHAHFDENKRQWFVECADGSTIWCKWFIPNLGFASKHYRPPVAGLSNFKGEVYHTAKWPQHGVRLKGRRIAQIGNGASGIQCAQEVAGDSKHFTLFQRTPNLCLPMNQYPLDPKEEQKKKDNGEYKRAFETARGTFAGFTYTFQTKKTFDDTEEERQKFFNELFNEKGGFHFWLNCYDDCYSDEKANDEAYKFWRSQVLKRITNPEKQKLLAPEVAPHPFGTKRPSLERTFYETMDKDNVTIVDVTVEPIVEVVAEGLKTKDRLIEADVMILATGFDSVTGSLAQLDIRGTDGGTVADHWKNGLKTATGIAMNKFPNLFFLYGPQAPTAFSNGPSSTQFQAEFVEDFMRKIQDEGLTRVEATAESEEAWTKRVTDEWNDSLFVKAKGWYSGGNIPGKKVEPLNWSGGIPKYQEALYDSIAEGYPGWTVSK